MSILNKLENYLEEHGSSTNPWAGELEHIQAQMKIPANSKEKQPLKHAELLKKWHNINDKYLGHEQDKARKNESVEITENKEISDLIQKSSANELETHLKKNPNLHWVHQNNIRNAIVNKRKKIGDEWRKANPNSVWNKKVGA